ncbi:MAG TPA: hypothetical protein V6C81_31610 [Planktothrix sp.]|jgi:hypothetical protein
MESKALSDIEKQAAAILGVTPKSIGKTQARQNFLPLVDGLGKSASAIEITDHEKPVAMLLSYTHWLALISKLAMLSKGEHHDRPNLIGSIQIVGDLEPASKKAAERFTRSIKETGEKL